MMGTKIFKIDAEMAEKIEVEVGTLNTEINLESSLKIKTTLLVGRIKMVCD